MSDLLAWVSANPWSSLAVGALFLMLLALLIGVAMRHNWTVTFWPPKLEPRKESPAHSAPSIRIQSTISAGRDAVVAGGNIHIGSNDDLNRAERKVDAAREKVREWGRAVRAGKPWDMQAWHYLGDALQLANEALEIDGKYQRAWTILADVHHRIGNGELAKECLRRSKSLATQGPNYPGRFWKEVSGHISTGYPFDRNGGVRRESAPNWFEDKFSRYRNLPEASLLDGKHTDA